MGHTDYTYTRERFNADVALFKAAYDDNPDYLRSEMLEDEASVARGQHNKAWADYWRDVYLEVLTENLGSRDAAIAAITAIRLGI